jgi:hypothetical protein
MSASTVVWGYLSTLLADSFAGEDSHAPEEVSPRRYPHPRTVLATPMCQLLLLGPWHPHE